MKYETEIDSQAISLELNEQDGRVFAKIGERNYEIEVGYPEDGVYLLFVGDKIYEARVADGDNQSLKVSLRGKNFAATIVDRKHLRAGAQHHEDGRQQLVAPMPGKVVRVILKVDDEVESGQGVVVVEAMKMQNEIKSPKAGRVTEIRVNEGEAVAAGQILAIVE
ncbi:MAG: acetyl-CoA carboxylase biotin carboxyl carrier protein subunit [Acidobacteriota bacterium]